MATILIIDNEARWYSHSKNYQAGVTKNRRSLTVHFSLSIGRPIPSPEETDDMSLGDR
ncbi:MAG: hypothetical protein WA973_18895 [Mesorhizobium sp.]